MAAAGIAVELREQRFDLGAEVDRAALRKAGDCHGNFKLLGTAFDADRGAAVAGRRDVAPVVDLGDSRVRAGVFGFAGHIFAAIGDEQLSAFERVVEFDLR